jgi:hypothetical protein
VRPARDEGTVAPQRKRTSPEQRGEGKRTSVASTWRRRRPSCLACRDGREMGFRQSIWAVHKWVYQMGIGLWIMGLTGLQICGFYGPERYKPPTFALKPSLFSLLVSPRRRRRRWQTGFRSLRGAKP